MTDQYKKALALAGGDDFLELGQSLYGLKNGQPQLFRRFLQDARIGRRKAYHLVAIWEWSRKHRLPRAQLREAGWTKLRVIRDRMAQPDGGTISREKVMEWLRVAQDHTAHELRTIVAGGEPEPTHCVLLYLSPQQYQTFEKAVLANGGSRKEKRRGLLGQERAILKALQNTSKQDQGSPHRGGDKRSVPETS